MYTQFDDAFADRLAIAKVAGLHLAQAHADPRLGHLVAQAVEPLGERFSAVFALIPEKFYHGAPL
jgi:hypothetical protein